MKRSAITTGTIGLIAGVSWLLGSTLLVHPADYVIRADDKLKIKIFQFPELSGDYTVNGTGTISIPPLGEIQVAGHSASEISKDISGRFVKAGISGKPGATVEVFQTRPIYVFGDVQKPGEYIYRNGLTVLQALSLAGGWYRVSDPNLVRLDRESITIRGDMRNLARRYYHLIAERARINAELALRSEVAFPTELAQKATGDTTLAQLLDEERSFLRINVDAFKTQLESLDKTRSLYEKGIEAVSGQILANNTQSQSVDKELNTMKSLFNRGLSPISTKWTLERMQAQIEIAGQGYQTIILRAQQNITEVEQKIFDLKSERQARLTKELQKIGADLDEISIKLDTSRQLMAEAELTTPSLIANSLDVVEARSLAVVRMIDGKSVTIDAEENTELLPGDVLKVEKSAIPSGIAKRQVVPGPSLFIPTSGSK